MPAIPSDKLTLDVLKQRGWSAGLIASLLGEHDSLARRSRRRRAAPMREWSLARVEVAEQATAFLTDMQKRPAMVARSLAVAEKKRAALIAEIADVEIPVLQMPLVQASAWSSEMSAPPEPRAGWRRTSVTPLI